MLWRLYSTPSILSRSLSSSVCESLLTYNPNSFDRDYGVLMKDRKRLWESEFGVMKQQCQGVIYEHSLSVRSAFAETQSVQISHYRKIQFWPRTKWSLCHFKRLNSVVCLIRYSEPTNDMSAVFPHNSRTICIQGNNGKAKLENEVYLKKKKTQVFFFGVFLFEKRGVGSSHGPGLLPELMTCLQQTAHLVVKSKSVRSIVCVQIPE